VLFAGAGREVVASPLGRTYLAPGIGARPGGIPKPLPSAPNLVAGAGQRPVPNRRLAIPGLRYYIQTGRRVRSTFPSLSCTDGLARV
jgi:hypothetical protein